MPEPITAVITFLDRGVPFNPHKASLIGLSRLIRKQRKPSDKDHWLVLRCVERIDDLTDRLDSLIF